MVRNINYSFNQQIPPGGISSDKIADGAITEAKLDSSIDFGVSAGTKKGYTFDATLAKAVPVRESRGDIALQTQTVASEGNLEFNGTSGNLQKWAYKFTLSTETTIPSIIVKLAKTALPTDGVQVRIVADNAGNPTGAAQGTSETISGASLTTTRTATTISFSPGITLSAGTYWFIIERTGAGDTTNKYVLGGSESGTPANNNSYRNDSGTWNLRNPGLVMTINKAEGTAGNAMQANSSDTASAKIVGFTSTAVAQGASAKVQNGGILDGFSGLDAGTTYYLKDDGTIGTTAGTVSKKVGRAISATELSIDIEE